MHARAHKEKSQDLGKILQPLNTKTLSANQDLSCHSPYELRTLRKEGSTALCSQQPSDDSSDYESTAHMIIHKRLYIIKSPESPNNNVRRATAQIAVPENISAARSGLVIEYRHFMAGYKG